MASNPLFFDIEKTIFNLAHEDEVASINVSSISNVNLSANWAYSNKKQTVVQVHSEICVIYAAGWSVCFETEATIALASNKISECDSIEDHIQQQLQANTILFTIRPIGTHSITGLDNRAFIEGVEGLDIRLRQASITNREIASQLMQHYARALSGRIPETQTLAEAATKALIEQTTMWLCANK